MCRAFELFLFESSWRWRETRLFCVSKKSTTAEPNERRTNRLHVKGNIGIYREQKGILGATGTICKSAAGWRKGQIISSWQKGIPTMLDPSALRRGHKIFVAPSSKKVAIFANTPCSFVAVNAHNTPQDLFQEYVACQNCQLSSRHYFYTQHILSADPTIRQVSQQIGYFLHAYIFLKRTFHLP